MLTVQIYFGDRIYFGTGSILGPQIRNQLLLAVSLSYRYALVDYHRLRSRRYAHLHELRFSGGMV